VCQSDYRLVHVHLPICKYATLRHGITANLQLHHAISNNRQSYDRACIGLMKSLISNLLNAAIFSDREWRLTQVSMSLCISTKRCKSFIFAYQVFFSTKLIKCQICSTTRAKTLKVMKQKNWMQVSWQIIASCGTAHHILMFSKCFPLALTHATRHFVNCLISDTLLDAKPRFNQTPLQFSSSAFSFEQISDKHVTTVQYVSCNQQY